MGILNLTPDSFFDGGLYTNLDSAVAHAKKMQADGADIIDIGAQSTRPGHVPVSKELEEERLLPILNALKNEITIPISVDTFYYDVALKAIDLGAEIINDISGGKNKQLLNLVASSKCGYILTHPLKEYYSDIITDINDFFETRLHDCAALGMDKQYICLDPGLGFVTDPKDNLKILNKTNEINIHDTAYLIGASNKRFIGTYSASPLMNERLFGTIAANTIAILNGANFIRVHNVDECKKAVVFCDSYLKNNQANI